MNRFDVFWALLFSTFACVSIYMKAWPIAVIYLAFAAFALNEAWQNK